MTVSVKLYGYNIIKNKRSKEIGYDVYGIR